MLKNYRDLTRLEMEQVDKENTIILIPVGALEQHGNQAPLGTDDIIAEAMVEYLGRALEEAGESDFPMLVFPVPGAPTNRRMEPDCFFFSCMTASCSRMRFLTLSRPK